jgi:hypothetical protein
MPEVIDVYIKKKKKTTAIKAPTMAKQKEHRLMVGSNRPGPYKAASKVWTGRFDWQTPSTNVSVFIASLKNLRRNR